ncbi:MAG: BamA/TamA family outer membrane protein, partial [Alphaproteobacteria bacterium]|nr:BamA/TamA family outer membrane protein [Alphaproteobacteria bacterium]
EKVNDKRFRILSFPQSLSIDTTKNLLDPKFGNRFNIILKPDFVMDKKQPHFFTVDFEASQYFSLDKISTHVLALRGKIGSIINNSFNSLPKTRLFYAGGAHSVRGYGYQMIGPLTNEINPKKRMPTGGRSLFEGAIEWRYRMTESFGLVPFMDFGVLSQNRFIKFKNLWSRTTYDSKLFTGVGLGGRYYLGDIGPVRVDIAVPLNKRRKIDRFAQFYASFGQSF